MLNDIACDCYKVAFKTTIKTYNFLDVRDVRNGEVYCFYKRLDEENYTFDSVYQEHSGYSVKDYKYNDANIREAIYYNRPACPFERFKEYKIKIRYEKFYTIIDNIEEIN